MLTAKKSKRVFLRRIEAETSIGHADYQFETLKNKALANEGIAHYLDSFSASLVNIFSLNEWRRNGLN